MPRENGFVITGARYTGSNPIHFSVSNFGRAEEYRSLYRGLCYKGVSYFGVPLDVYRSAESFSNLLIYERLSILIVRNIYT